MTHKWIQRITADRLRSPAFLGRPTMWGLDAVDTHTTVARDVDGRLVRDRKEPRWVGRGAHWGAAARTILAEHLMHGEAQRGLRLDVLPEPAAVGTRVRGRTVLAPVAGPDHHSTDFYVLGRIPCRDGTNPYGHVAHQFFYRLGQQLWFVTQHSELIRNVCRAYMNFGSCALVAI